jgi:hypothetical protein
MTERGYSKGRSSQVYQYPTLSAPMLYKLQSVCKQSANKTKPAHKETPDATNIKGSEGFPSPLTA